MDEQNDVVMLWLFPIAVKQDGALQLPTQLTIRADSIVQYMPLV